MDTLNVTNGDFLEFVRAGGYDHRPLWSDDDWRWIQQAGIRHPKFWIPRRTNWFYRTMFEEILLPLEWPVYVSHAEASAYARWKGKSLPTEAQFHRAAFGSVSGTEPALPAGNFISSPGPRSPSELLRTGPARFPYTIWSGTAGSGRAHRSRHLRGSRHFRFIPGTRRISSTASTSC